MPRHFIISLRPWGGTADGWGICNLRANLRVDITVKVHPGTSPPCPERLLTLATGPLILGAPALRQTSVCACYLSNGGSEEVR